MDTNMAFKPSIGHAKGLIEQAKLYRQGKEPEKALETLEQAITAAPNLAEPYRLKSEILKELGKSKDAMQANMKYMQLQNREKWRDDNTPMPGSAAEIDRSQLLAGTPWISILFRPRATIRWILETASYQYVIPLAMLSGFSTALFLLASLLSSSIFIGLIAVLVVGPFLGIIGLYIYTAIYESLGSIFGGVATFEQVKAALAWSLVPAIPNQIIFLALLFTITPCYLTNSLTISLFIIWMILKIWSWVLVVCCFSEVNHFSIRRALATWFIPYLIPLLFYMIISVQIP